MPQAATGPSPGGTAQGDVRQRVVVVGAGAMGSLLGAHLARSHLSVTFLERRVDLVAALSDRGLTIHMPDGRSWTQSVQAQSDPAQVGPADWVFVCVKAPDTSTAAQSIAPLVRNGATVLSLQNGIGNKEAIEAVCGPGRVLVGTISAGAYLGEPGHLVVAGLGPIVLGDPLDPRSDRVLRAASLLETAGFEVSVESDIQRAVWNKLVVNVGINALTAVLGVENGTLLELPAAEEVMVAAVREAAAVAKALGLDIDDRSALENTRAVARATASNRSSMLSDLLAGRRTEVAHINGAVARLADDLGLSAPVNRLLSGLVEALSEASVTGKLVSERAWIEKGPRRQDG